MKTRGCPVKCSRRVGNNGHLPECQNGQDVQGTDCMPIGNATFNCIYGY